MENIIETFATVSAYINALISGRLPREYEPDGYYAAAMNPDGSIIALARHSDLCGDNNSYRVGFWSKNRVRLCMRSTRDGFNVTRRGVTAQFEMPTLTQKQVSTLNSLARNWADGGNLECCAKNGKYRNTASRAEFNSFLREYLPTKVNA